MSFIRQGTYAWIPGQARDDALGTAGREHGKSCTYKPSPRTRCGAQRHTSADGAWIPGQARDDALETANGRHGKSCAHKPSPRTRCGAQSPLRTAHWSRGKPAMTGDRLMCRRKYYLRQMYGRICFKNIIFA